MKRIWQTLARNFFESRGRIGRREEEITWLKDQLTTTQEMYGVLDAKYREAVPEPDVDEKQEGASSPRQEASDVPPGGAKTDADNTAAVLVVVSLPPRPIVLNILS